MPSRPTIPLGLALATAALAPGQGYPPDQAAGKMTVPSGFKVQLVASEIGRASCRERV